MYISSEKMKTKNNTNKNNSKDMECVTVMLLTLAVISCSS